MYQLLENPYIYNLSQQVLAPGARYFLNKYFKFIFNHSQGYILDVGCGPKLNTTPPDGKVMGVDVNFQYIKCYAKESSQGGIVCKAEALPFHNNTFDESRSFGLLHHLPRENAILTIREMIRCTRLGGKVIIIDGVWPKNAILRPLAWLTRRLDRGKWMLQENDFIAMIEQAYQGPWEKLSRFTYSLWGHEALAVTLKK